MTRFYHSGHGEVRYPEEADPAGCFMTADSKCFVYIQKQGVAVVSFQCKLPFSFESDAASTRRSLIRLPMRTLFRY